MKAITLYPHAPALGPICLGGSTFGREIDETAAFKLMDHAVARGVALFDTAATYSKGASEYIVGAWLATRKPASGALTVATKIYPPYTPADIETAVAGCATRLRQATLDVLYLHLWDQAVEDPATLIALDQLIKTNRVRALGVCNFTATQLSRALSLQAQLGLQPFSVTQNNNNFAVRDVDPALVELCADKHLAMVTYSPLGAGFLTGKHQHGVQPGSRFDVSPGHQNVYFNAVAMQRLAKLEEISKRHNQPMTRLALAWAFNQAGVDSVLVGGRTPDHLDQAFDALTFGDKTILTELNSQ